MSLFIAIGLFLSTPVFIALIICVVSNKTAEYEARTTLKRATIAAGIVFTLLMASAFILPYTDYLRALPNVTVHENIELSGTSEITIRDLLTVNNNPAYEHNLSICTATWEDGTCNGVNLETDKINLNVNKRIIISDYTPGDTLIVYVSCGGGHHASIESDIYKIPVTLK